MIILFATHFKGLRSSVLGRILVTYRVNESESFGVFMVFVNIKNIFYLPYI